MMVYLRVKWIHDMPDEPVFLYSEINERRQEVRKVHVFRDGRLEYASEDHSTETTFLGLEPIPSLVEIDSSPEFEPAICSRADFEELWSRAQQGGQTRG